MAENSFEKYKLRRKMQALKDKRSQDGSTCLVSLYIPEGRGLADFVQQLTNELGTAANIKSKTTRKNVQAAISVTLGKLKRMGPKSPKNGIVIFTGVTAETQTKTESYIISPIVPINKKLYVCDSFFHTDYLEDHLLPKKTYGLCAIDQGNATIATLEGSRLNILKSTKSMVPKKHKAGGQSAARFGRLRDDAILKFYKRVSNLLKEYFLDNPDKKIEGIIIGGPGAAKNTISDAPYLDTRIKEKIMKRIDIGYVADKQGMKELVEASKDVLHDVRFVEEKRIVKRWLEHIYKDDGYSTYGEREIRAALETGALNLLLLSEGLNQLRVTIECPQCKYIEKKSVKVQDLPKLKAEIQSRNCEQCSSSLLTISETMDLIEDLGDLAQQSGCQVEIISTDTEEGQQVLHFGGITGVLRYLLDY